MINLLMLRERDNIAKCLYFRTVGRPLNLTLGFLLSERLSKIFIRLRVLYQSRALAHHAIAVVNLKL